MYFDLMLFEKSTSPVSSANYTVIPRTSDALFHLFQHFKQIRYAVSEEEGLNSSELELLLILAHAKDNCSIKFISEQMHLCSQAITKISRALEKRELVYFEKSTQDRRVTFVKLSDSGQVVVQRERLAREKALQHAIAKMEDTHFGQADHENETRETASAIGESQQSELDKANEAIHQSGGAFSPSFLADSLSIIAEHIGKTSI